MVGVLKTLDKATGQLKLFELDPFIAKDQVLYEDQNEILLASTVAPPEVKAALDARAKQGEAVQVVDAGCCGAQRGGGSA